MGQRWKRVGRELLAGTKSTYHSVMTKLLEQAFEAAQNLPSAMQDDLARIVLQFTGEDLPIVQLTPEEDAALARSEAAAARGEFATDDEVRAVWSKHGL
jgi:hypothetical protein